MLFVNNYYFNIYMLIIFGSMMPAVLLQHKTLNKNVTAGHTVPDPFTNFTCPK